MPRKSKIALMWTLVMAIPLLFFQNCGGDNASSNPPINPFLPAEATPTTLPGSTPATLEVTYDSFMVINTSQEISVTGGLPPYVYRVINGEASFQHNTLTVEGNLDNVTIEISDSTNETRTREIKVVGEIFFINTHDNYKLFKSSDFGKTWEELGLSTSPTSYDYTYFKNKLWKVGGNDFHTSFGSVQYSINGLDWTDAGSLPAPRAYGTLVSTDEALWYFGGNSSLYNGSQYIHKNVYRSFDGTSWEAMEDLPEPRTNPCAAKLDNTLFVFGGRSAVIGAASHNNVWGTQSGLVWTSFASFPAMSSYGVADQIQGECVNYRNKIWIVGSRYTTTNGDYEYPIFNFENNVWTKVSTSGFRLNTNPIVYADKIVMMGKYPSQLLSTSDGTEFKTEIANGITTDLGSINDSVGYSNGLLFEFPSTPH
jgi:hypothetical protein